MKFSEWFDPLNMRHMEALKHFVEKGNWPDSFLPDNCHFNMSKELAIISDELARMFIDNYEDIVQMLEMKRVIAKIRSKKKSV